MAPPIIDRFLNWVAPVQGIDIENVSDAKRNSLVRARAESAGFKFDDDTQRVDPSKLELIYMRDPDAFNGINVVTKTFLATNYNIENDHDGKLTKFLNENNFHELLLKIIQHLCIYGNSWVELMYRMRDVRGFDGTVRQEKVLAGLDMLDPKLMDFRRDQMNRIIFDSLGFPKEIVQYIPPNKDIDENRYEVVQQNDTFGHFNTAIIIDKYDIAHFSLYTVGDNPVGIGLLEPLYNTINPKKMIERGIAQNIHRMGYPRMWVKVGDNTMPATNDELEDAFNKVRSLNEKTEVVTPHNYDIKVLQGDSVAPLQEHLTYFKNEMITGMGVPKPFVTGEAEGGSGSHTLEMQKVLFDRNIRMLQHVVSKIIETEIFARFARENNFPNWIDHPPKLTWDDVSEETTSTRLESIVKLVEAGVLTNDENLEVYVRKELQLPPVKFGGGKGEGTPDAAFDPIQLKKGIQHEMEHTRDPNVAKQIAKDHLTEHSRYYDYLERMEAMMQGGGQQPVGKTEISPDAKEQV